MSLENVFTSVNILAFFSWICLFVFYTKKWIYMVLFSGVLVLLSFIYIYFIIQGLGPSSEGGFGSLNEVAALFQNKQALLAGWIHYLVFDLFVGMWICQDAANRGLNRVWVLTSLAFTFTLGPIGLLIYFIMRIIKTKTFIQSPFNLDVKKKIPHRTRP